MTLEKTREINLKLQGSLGKPTAAVWQRCVCLFEQALRVAPRNLAWCEVATDRAKREAIVSLNRLGLSVSCAQIIAMAVFWRTIANPYIFGVVESSNIFSCMEPGVVSENLRTDRRRSAARLVVYGLEPILIHNHFEFL